MSIHAWILLGLGGARKGSTIRALTGIYGAQPVEIMRTNGESIQITPTGMSLNEGPNALTPSQWVSNVTKTVGQDNNILVALRVGIVRRPPDAYVSAFMRAGGIVESIVTLGDRTPTWVISSGVSYAHIVDNEIPTNAIAAQVRQLWGWR